MDEHRQRTFSKVLFYNLWCAGYCLKDSRVENTHHGQSKIQKLPSGIGVLVVQYVDPLLLDLDLLGPIRCFAKAFSWTWKMAAKTSRPGRLETEIEKYRGDGNWSRVLDLSRQVSAKTPHLGNCFGIFVVSCNLYESIPLLPFGVVFSYEVSNHGYPCDYC